MSTHKIKLAIDGCGDLTSRTILPHMQLPDAKAQFEIVALCDIVPEKARELAQQFAVKQHFASLEHMLEYSDADAVLVVVPAHLHGEHALMAMRSGRHVYAQKPLAPSLKQADELLRAASECSVHLVAAPYQAQWPLFEQAKSLIQSGEIGAPYVAFGPLMGWGGFEIHHGSDPSWCFAEGSGPLRDHGVYGLQTLTSMLGPVARVAALAGIRTDARRWRDTDIKVTEADCTSLLLEFKSGAQGMMGEAWCAAFDEATRFRIHGLEGMIEGLPQFAGYHGIFPLACRVHHPGKEPHEIRIDPAAVPYLQGEHLWLQNPHIYADIWHLGQCIRGQADSRESAQQARHTVDILETALEAARSGRVLELTTSF